MNFNAVLRRVTQQAQECWTACSDTVSAVLVDSKALKSGQQEVHIAGKRYRVLEHIGDGGYALVHACRQIGQAGELGPCLYALKTVSGADEQMQLAQREADTMKHLPEHPNLLRLLAFDTHTGSGRSTAYLLFDLVQGGSLFDLVQRNINDGGRMLPLADSLGIFVQICEGLEAIHGSGLAHCDIKPPNVLLRRSGGSTLSMLHDYDDRTIGTSHVEMTGRISRLNMSVGDCTAVLIDFGSCRSSEAIITSRAQAVALQEHAEMHCSAPYRAVELWDVPSRCQLDLRACDVWSAGCVLFFMLCQVSPFERVLSEAGGSLSLAIMNGAVQWPDPAAVAQPVRELVSACLTQDPAQRPIIAQIKARAQQLLR